MIGLRIAGLARTPAGRRGRRSAAVAGVSDPRPSLPWDLESLTLP
jgi:hypothetical protein